MPVPKSAKGLRQYFEDLKELAYKTNEVYDKIHPSVRYFHELPQKVQQDLHEVFMGYRQFLKDVGRGKLVKDIVKTSKLHRGEIRTKKDFEKLNRVIHTGMIHHAALTHEVEGSTLSGSGFFDSILSGIKKVGSFLGDNAGHIADIGGKALAKLTGLPIDDLVNSDNLDKLTRLAGRGYRSEEKRIVRGRGMDGEVDYDKVYSTIGATPEQREALFQDDQLLDPAYYPELKSQGIGPYDQVVYDKYATFFKNGPYSGPKYKAALQSFIASLSDKEKAIWNDPGFNSKLFTLNNIHHSGKQLHIFT